MNKTWKLFRLGVGASAMLVFGAASYAVTLGVVVPLTGPSATIGDDQRRGAELAIEEINKNGGVLGEDLKIIFEDSGGTASTGVSAARKLVSVNKTPVVLGAYSSGVTIPIAEYVVQEGNVHVNVGSSSPSLRKIGDGSYSVIGLDELSARFAADDVIGEGFKKVAFIAPNNAYGQDLADEFKKTFEGSGGEVTTTVLYTEGQTTYRRELQQMQRSGAEAYVYSAYGQDSATINHEAFELGLNKQPWYAIYLTMCTSDTLPEAAQGHLGLEVATLGEDGKPFREAYNSKYSEAPRTTFAVYMYDGVKLIADTINKLNSEDPAKIREALNSLESYHGATGNISFGEDGQRLEQPYDKVKYDNGAVVAR